MAPSLFNNVTERSKARRKRMSIAFLTQQDNEDEPLPPTCAPYTTRMKAPAKSIAERPQNVNYTATQRLQALTLVEAGISEKIACASAGVKDTRCIKRWLRKAEQNGYDRTQSKVMTLEHVQDACRSGRPIICGPAKQAAIEEEGMILLLFAGFC